MADDASAPAQPHTELLGELGLPFRDLARLQEGHLTIMELMTEQLQPIAWKKELERRENAEAEWEHHEEEIQWAHRERIREPVYYGTDPAAELTELEALDNLAAEIDQGICAHNDLHTSKAYDLGIKDELPEWMTWRLLGRWTDQLSIPGPAAAPADAKST